MQTLVRRKATGERPLIIDLLLAVVIGLIGALAKRHLDFHLGIPGHAGVGWIAAMVAGRLVNGRVGMATTAGVSMGLWGGLVGLSHPLGYNLLLYGFAGGLLDSGTVLRLPMRRAWGAALAGAVVHLAKFGFVFANAWISTTTKRIEIYGALAGLANHLVFGLVGGILGWLVWRSGRSAVGVVEPILRRRIMP